LIILIFVHPAVQLLDERETKTTLCSLLSTPWSFPMSKTDWIQQEIDNLQAQGLYNRIRTIESPQGAWLTVDGKRVLNFCSNNYLGLANHPDIV